MACNIELNTTENSASCSEVMSSARIKSCHLTSTSVNDIEGNAAEHGTIDPSISHTRSSQDALEEIKEANNWKLSDQNKVGLGKLTLLSVWKRCVTLANELSIVGLFYLVKPSSHKVGSVIRTFVWTTLLLFGVSVMIFQIRGSIAYYLSYPTTVKYSLAYSGRLRFPAVTVCDENNFNRQRAVKIFGPNMTDLIAKAYPPFQDLKVQTNSTGLNMSSLGLDWTATYRSLLVPMEEVLLQCTFKNAPCNLTEAMQITASEKAYCFQFNGEATNYMTTQTGAIYGLRLVLWTNQSDFLVVSSPAAGFRVLLHEPHEIPDMFVGAFLVSAGKSTVVSFSLRNTSQLPYPYGNCRNQANYTFNKCMAQCKRQYVLDRCNCRAPESVGVSGPVCNPEQYARCVKVTTSYFVSSGDSRRCDCPLHCTQRSYPFSISTSPLSELFLNHTSKKLQFLGRNLTMSKLSRELIYLEIFYSDLTYTNIETIPAYGVLGLFCDIGNAFGLILGGTVLTAFEIIQFLLGLVMDLVTSGKFVRMQRSAKKQQCENEPN